MRRLPAAEPHHHRRLLPTAQHGGLFSMPGWVQCLQQAGSTEGIPAGPSRQRRHPKNGGDHSIRPLRIYSNAVWFEKRWDDLPAHDGPDSCRHPVRVHLPGRRLGGQQVHGRPHAAPPHSAVHPPGDRASPLPDRVQAIQSFPFPSTVRDLQGFLGLFIYYCHFVASAAAIIRPLTEALKGGRAGGSKLQWSDEMRASFQAAKAALSTMCQLDHPSPTAQLSFATDAFASHIGSELQQRRPGSHWRPLGFYSTKLDNAQLCYRTFDRELLAVFLAVRYFRFMLEGRQFMVFTDHRPLVGALHRIAEPWSARQQRQLSFICEFTADIRHTPGADRHPLQTGDGGRRVLQQSASGTAASGQPSRAGGSPARLPRL
jgi:RNase H-like domain found in reverse transcriptase